VASHALALESLLQGSAGAAKKPGGILLAGLGAKLHRASDLASQSQRSAAPLAPCLGIESLLEGGLPRGKLIELAGRRSSGRFSIGMAALASVTSTGEPAALVDLGEHLDPQAAAAAGVDLELLLWVRPRRVKEALASTEMLLAAGFPLVVADLGLSPRGARYVPDAAWLRLARAAQAQSSALLLLTPWRMSGIAADAVLTSDSSRPRWQGIGKTPRLLTTLNSRLTLQKLARTAPGLVAPISFSVFPEGLPQAENPRSKPVLSSITNHKSPITNPSRIHPAALEIRDPRPQIRNGVPSITNHQSPITNAANAPVAPSITNHKSQITNLS
jgi:recA bacterial DNA recombination protein